MLSKETENQVSEKCLKCNGSRCPYCLQTGKKLYEIGEQVVWDNQDGTHAPMSVREEEYEKYVGKIYRVNALQAYPDESDRYYVGIDVVMEIPNAPPVRCNLLFDTNLRRPRPEEQKGKMPALPPLSERLPGSVV